MTLEQVLGNRYTVTSRLPAASATHQRYVLNSSSGTGERFLLSYCDYARPVSAAALARQQKVADAMARPPVALLCRVVEMRLETEYQVAVSEFPGEMSLRELLQQRQALALDEVEAFLRLLTEASESAVSLGWPLLRLDAQHLYLDSRLGLPRIPAPDIPSFEAVGTGAPDIDPLQTMAFDAAALRQQTDPIPSDSRDYVLPLAALCCDLLGQPQSLRGGSTRYKPLPQLTAQQNSLLKRSFAGDGRNAFPSAKAFMDEFFGISAPRALTAHTETLRTLSATLTHTSHQLTEATPAADKPTTVRFTSRPTSTLPYANVAPLSIGKKDQVSGLTPITRIRLMPNSEDAPVLALVAAEWLKLGRSASDADFVGQFRPRSNINDGRSRRISRIQSRLKREGDNLIVEEPGPLNASVLLDQPLGDHTVLPLPVTILLAGEYPVEIRHVPSDYRSMREIIDVPHVEVTPLSGAMVVRPNTSGVLLWESALLYTDVGLHFSASGKPWFRTEANIMPAARLHRLKDQFWIEPLDIALVRSAYDEEPTEVHELILLSEGARFRAGSYTYTVQSYTLSPDPVARATA